MEIDDRLAAAVPPERDGAKDENDAVRKAFTALADQWRRETAMLSSITNKLNHSAYLKIIAMGKPAVGLILEEMGARPAYWFKALESIVGTSPIPKDQPADLETATAAWLAWGKDRGYTKA
jgi:hypothetical protein